MLSVRSALTLAGLCLLGLAVTWLLAAIVPATHVRDAILLADFTRLDHSLVHTLASALLALLATPVYVVWCAVLVAFALWRNGRQVAVTVLLLVALAPLSAELLKPLLAHHHASGAHIIAASWPSGHTTEGAILAWVGLGLAPAGRRRAIALAGALLALCVGCALLILAWHMPSDVLGGYLLASLWASLAVAALHGLELSPWAPGSHKDSGPSFAARLRMNNMSDSRFR